MNGFDNHTEFLRPSLRVGFITPSLAPGGAERWLVDLIRNLSTVRCSGLVVPESAYLDPSLLSEIPRHVKIYGPEQTDSLFSHSDVVLGWGHYDFLPYMREHHVPTILVSHTTQPYAPGFRANFYGAVCTAAAAAYGNDITDRVGVTIIGNGISTDRLSPRRTREDIRESLGISPGERVFLSVTRLSPEKNPGAFIELANRNPDSTFILYGWGPLAYELSKRPPVRSNRCNLIFMQPTFGPGIADIYRASDYFVMASPAEAFPLTFLEAAYCRLPIVVPHMYSFIEEFNLGPHVIKNSLETLGELCGDTDPHMGIKLRDEFHIGSMVHKWETYFHQCVETFRQANTLGQVVRR